MASANPPGERFDVFAQCAPGLEPIVARELKALGLKPRKDAGGVSFRAGLTGIYSANLWLRTASRVVVRIARFHASTFHELERRAKKVGWEQFLGRSDVHVRVTCRKSRLYHSDAVGERILAAIARVAPDSVGATVAGSNDRDSEQSDEVDEADDAAGVGNERSKQLFVVRIVDDQCEISVDSSGDLLHKRGYRQESGKAPLRETLAAAMVLASGWEAHSLLVDPMCGSGTIPIEAALIARGVAPGLQRKFQFMNWPEFATDAWENVRDAALAAASSRALRVCGSDRDAGAIDAARRNAARAGLGDAVEFSTAALSDSLSRLNAEEPGWIITNPPYGVRVGDVSDLRNLYAALGSRIRNLAAWRLGILAADASLARQAAVAFRLRLSTTNGGIPVDFLLSSASDPGVASGP
jgi:putative N6-adenine-specific DNA methylase